MDITELALVRQRVADLHRDAQVSRLAAAARAGRPDRVAELRGVAREALHRASARTRTVRPATVDGGLCCA